MITQIKLAFRPNWVCAYEIIFPEGAYFSGSCSCEIVCHYRYFVIKHDTKEKHLSNIISHITQQLEPNKKKLKKKNNM
jgi:hypothetical protein